MTPEEFTARYMPQFSEQQRAAVRETEGPVLLLAVPGSGKTTVLVTRLGYMALCRGIDPAHILAVTYTVAATRELRARFTARFPELAGRTPEFRTINGLSSKIIEACGRQRGPAFALQENTGELAALVGRIYQALNGDYPTDSTIREVRTAITYCKNMMLSADEIAAQDFGLPRFAALYAHYCTALREARQMDYDDQMAYALAILRKRPEILAEFQERYPYLCVDESQDTSRVQHAIIELLARKTGNLFMVGDEDQSIYGFRAAYPEALLRFSAVWPGAKTLLLEDNYRSTPEILRLAGAFIEGSRERYPKTIRAKREPSAEAFLDRLAALRQTICAHEDAPDALLTLSTIHSSKGLEYERVYLLDIQDGVLPSRPDAADGTEDERRAYEEDRRLFYVAMTRAKDELTLFDYPDAPSAFIREAQGYLPVPVRARDDFAAIVPENACGLRYRHEARGEGRILAQCEDELLIAFPDGDTLMQAGRMLLERSRAEVLQQPDAPAAAQTPDAQAFVPGSVIQHKKYGMGRIVSTDGPFADIRFEGEADVRRFDLAKSLRSGFLFAAR